MIRIALIPTGAIALILLAWFCARSHAPVIEADLAARGRIALDAENMDWARLDMDGRDSIVTGIAPNEKARAKAAVLIAALTGMRSVRNQLDVAARPPAPAAPDAKPGPVPYELSMVRTMDGVVLQGLVPDATARGELREAARRHFGDDVSDELELAAGAPGDWLDVAKDSLHYLEALEKGSIELRNTRLRIKGVAVDEDVRKQIEDAVANQTPVTYTARAAITISPETILRRCQERMNSLLEEEQIQFAAGSANISPESYPLLDDLAAVANSCSDAHLLISGHTDSTGSAEANQALSRMRAESVAAYLIEVGLEADRLSTVGGGESRPLADNDTPEGRSRNRRIEIEVQRGDGI